MRRDVYVRRHFPCLASGRSTWRRDEVRAWVHRVLTLGMLGLAAAARPAVAGDINLQWDAVQGAAGYHVYYGTQSGVYDEFVSTNGTSTTIAGLQDCQTYYLAVKAYNGAGESS